MMGLAGKRIMIDASAASIGGGFTYLVNIVPHLCDLAPDTRFRLMVGSERLQAAMPTCENLEVIHLQIESAAQRMRQTFFSFPKAAAEWRADLDQDQASITLPEPGEYSSPRVRNGAIDPA